MNEERGPKVEEDKLGQRHADDESSGRPVMLLRNNHNSVEGFFYNELISKAV